MLALLVMLAAPAAATASPVNACTKLAGFSDKCPSLERVYDFTSGQANGGQDSAQALAISPKGDRFFVTGASMNDSHPGSVDFITLAYALPSGTLLWSARYDSLHRSDYAQLIALSPDGKRVYVAGFTQETGAATTVAYATDNGRRLWSSTVLPSLPSGTNIPTALALSRDGKRLFVGMEKNYVAVGVKSDGSDWNQVDYGLVAYDAVSGRLAWSAGPVRPTGKRQFGHLHALAVSPDGTQVYATGSSGLIWGPDQIVTVAYWATGIHAGRLLWQRTYSYNRTTDSRAYSMKVSPDGSRIYVGGLQDAAGAWNVMTVVYDRAGRRLKVILDPGVACTPDETQASDRSCYAYLELSRDGKRLYVADSMFNTFAHRTSDGASLWSAPFDPKPLVTTRTSLPKVQAQGLAVSPDGARVYLCGYVDITLYSTEYASLALSASSGSRAWLAYYNDSAGLPAGADIDRANAIAVTPDNKLVLEAGDLFHGLVSAAQALTKPVGTQNVSDVGVVGYPAG